MLEDGEDRVWREKMYDPALCDALETGKWEGHEVERSLNTEE